ncbi:hypothetical protein BST61_g4572 [Cercospora zeina]
MTSFTSLLGSIGGSKQNQAPASKPSTTTNRPEAPPLTKPPPATSGLSRPVSRPTANNVTAGVKRKPDEQLSAPPAKTVRTEVRVPVRPSATNGTSAKTASSPPSTNAPYRGTARPAQAGGPARLPAAPGKTLPSASTPATSSAASSAPKPKRGFASLLEKAKAAQEAVKAAGTNTIKHKPVEKLTKKDRLKQHEEMKQKPGHKGGQAAMANRSRSGTPADGKSALQKRPAPEPAYKGTMKKTPVQPEISYKGTMKRAEPGAAPSKPVAKKGLGQDKYGGYASWSDLDEAEDEDEEGYGSDGSDDMDAGFDDMAREEELALRAARKEDQEALEEEERHRREKLERKKKLEALSKSAAAQVRFGPSAQEPHCDQYRTTHTSSSKRAISREKDSRPVPSGASHLLLAHQIFLSGVERDFEHQSTTTSPNDRPTDNMADADYNAEEAAELKRKRAFRKFSYRGIDLDELLDLSSEQLRDVVHARARRRFNRGLKRKPMGLIKKLRKAKQEAKPNEKPDVVKTHLRDMIIVPEMIGSVVGVYSGKEFNQVEIKPEMVGHYLGEFSISYKPVKHGRPGIGATHSSRFIPLK